MPPILIVSAFPAELAPLARLLDRSRLERIEGLLVRRGEIAGRPVRLCSCGEGRASGDALARLLDPLEPEAVLGLGVAGGLTPDLAPGALIRGTRVIGLAREQLEPPAWEWTAAAGRLDGERGGTVVTVSRIAQSPSEKRRIASELGLEERSVVDLESIGWAGAAAGRRLPWLVLRAVSDAVDEELPLDFDRFRGGGAVSRRRVAAHALVRPWLWPRLARLRRRVAECAEKLALATEELLA